MSAIIKIDHLNLYYEKGKPTEVHALKDINVEIEKGDYVAFFGPSGCGKTTMLYALSGIDRFQDGHVYVNDHDLSGLSNQELAIFRQTGIGIVFQQFNLVPSLNVLKNVALPMLFVGVNSDKADAQAKKLLERLNLTEFADRFPYELSGGQQQRVGIARALANDPPIIIADEPLGNLDSVNAKRVLEVFKELNEKDGRTIIMVTHESWSLRDAKTVLHVKDGSITQIEKVKNIFNVSANSNTQANNGTGANEEKISARILANFLMRGCSLDEILRFESFVNDRFSLKINDKEFHKLLHLPFKDGGLGFCEKKTRRIFEYIERLIDKKKEVSVIYSEIEKNPEIPITDEVRDIRNWLIDDYNGKLSPFQIMAIDQVVSDRIRNYINSSEVSEVLDLNKSKFGVGLSFRSAQSISEKLELVLN